MANHEIIAKKLILGQAEALKTLATDFPNDFNLLIENILQINGRVVLAGMGKSGYIAKKISASLSSTGTPAFYIHPSEASHGDLGMITSDDLIIMISNSGETSELFNIISYAKRFNIKIAGITMREGSTLAKNSDFLLLLPKQKESSVVPVPTTSTLMALSIGDALVTALHESKGFTKDDFRLFHPGGKIGANLLKVSDLMHKKDELPIVDLNANFSEVITIISQKRLGCAIILNDRKIYGIITDGDLRRHIGPSIANQKAKDLMSQCAQTISKDNLASEALKIMNDKKITVLPALEDGWIVGVIHIHDILKAGVS